MQILFENVHLCLQYDSIEHGNDCGRTKRIHITTKTALRSEFLLSQEGKDEVIIHMKRACQCKRYYTCK